MRISLIVACASNRVIGKNNNLAWSLPDDMRYFMETTRGHCVVMGRKNWESIPPRFRPLKDRTNIVLTHNHDLGINEDNTLILYSLEDAIRFGREHNESELFVIGGAQVYKQAMPYVDTMYITEVNGEPDGDTYFPEWDRSEWEEVRRDHHPKDDRHMYSFDFVVYRKR